MGNDARSESEYDEVCSSDEEYDEKNEESTEPEPSPEPAHIMESAIFVE